MGLIAPFTPTGQMCTSRNIEIALSPGDSGVEQTGFLFRSTLISAAIQSWSNYRARQPTLIVPPVLWESLCFDINDEYDGEFQTFCLVYSRNCHKVWLTKNIIGGNVVTRFCHVTEKVEDFLKSLSGIDAQVDCLNVLKNPAEDSQAPHDVRVKIGTGQPECVQQIMDESLRVYPSSGSSRWRVYQASPFSK